MPEPPRELERLDLLGKRKEFPAHSCLDIKRYGKEDIPSGVYFIVKPGKG